MTLVDTTPAEAEVSPAGDAPKAAAARPAARPRREPSAAGRIVSTAILIASAALLGFVVWVAFLSNLYYARAQHSAYANFRVELAKGTAPVGPTTDSTNPAAPLLPLGSPVAVLSVPSLGLRSVVFEGTTSGVLMKGPGHLRDTPLPGQAGVSEIMGRATTYGGPFGRLASLRAGDTFTVTTGQGVASYRVLDLRRAGDPTPAPLAAGGGRLILATADGPAFWPSGTLWVDADLTSTAQPSPPLLPSTALTPAEHAMAADSSAWLPLMLWGQALVIAAAGIAWLRARWGRWQTWIVAVGVIGFLGVAVAGAAARLLPNLM